MNENQPLRDEQVERLVREHLLREAQTVDAAAILAGVRTRTAAHVPPSTPARAVKFPVARWSGRAALAMAATVLLAILWALPVSTPVASAETLVREVQQTHARPLELCYLHTIAHPHDGDGENGLLLPPEGKLWTRGDRFFMETVFPNGRVNAWGRDAKGRVWYAPLPSAGFRFEANEVPEPLARMSDLRTMNVDKLLTELLAHCDLQKKETAGEVQVIEAHPKANRPMLPQRFARLEIDTRQKLLRKIEMQRRSPHGLVHVSFTLIENAPRREDGKYTLEGHLAEDAQVFSMNHPPPVRYKLLRERYEMGRRTPPDLLKFLRGKKS